jgi:hypothetical protein
MSSFAHTPPLTRFPSLSLYHSHHLYSTCSQNNSTLEDELAALIRAGRIPARLDGAARVLLACRPPGRASALAKAAASGEAFASDAAAVLLRTALLRAGLVARPGSGRQGGGGSGRGSGVAAPLSAEAAGAGGGHAGADAPGLPAAGVGLVEAGAGRR